MQDKRDVLRINTPNIEIDCWEICNQLIKETNSIIHLGITRNTTGNIVIENLIQQGRRTLYSLFGAGLHGKNGINPPISKHIWPTFVTPRLLYSTEILQLKDSDIKRLDLFQIKTLKQLQWLPDRCAGSAVYLLLGAEPIQQQIDKKILTLFGQITRDPDTLEFQIAQRQISIHEINSTSWFSLVLKLLLRYDLPTALEVLTSPLTKTQWKNMIDKKINQYWMKHILEKENKSSLKFMSKTLCQFGKQHSTWSFVRDNPTDVQKAAIKTRILTGCYTLQANRSKFNQYKVDPSFLLNTVAVTAGTFEP
jgi:hypothetical protein